ncbi:MAG: hypothetical protein QMD61_03200 [Methanobacterium sp.]|nr:hypothetical protein [Methanobacterium sp.]
MSKNSGLRELTLKIIGEKELSKRKLLEEIRKTSNISDKTLNEILMSFLKDKKIYIIGYDFDVYEGIKRIQSIKSEGIVFGLIRTEPLDINILLKKLDSEDPIELKDAFYKLKIIFRQKISEINNSNMSFDLYDSDTLFNRIILHIKSRPKNQKETLQNKLALGLSNERNSLELLEHLINYIVSHDETKINKLKIPQSK